MVKEEARQGETDRPSPSRGDEGERERKRRKERGRVGREKGLDCIRISYP